MYKFLLIEDSDTDIESFLGTIKRMNMEAATETYQLCVAKSYEEGISSLSDDFSGIIIDIKLNGEKSGNDVIHTIVDEHRVPVVVFTGTPDTDLEEGSPIKVYKKGEAKQEDIVLSLCKTFDTGLFNVIGGKGILEKILNQIFWSNLYPQIHLWETKKLGGVDTEKILMRYAISHIQELIEDELPPFVTEEMYISPPILPNIKTGSIFQSAKDGLYCIVLSPPCDLAVHDGKIKTDRILVCEIDNHDLVNRNITDGITSHSKKTNRIQSAIKNNYTDYYHWLPKNRLFCGGYINFRKVMTYSPDQFCSEYSAPVAKVQEYFVKNILNRFSAYYARQGQPDFDFEQESDLIVRELSPVESI